MDSLAGPRLCSGRSCPEAAGESPRHGTADRASLRALGRASTHGLDPRRSTCRRPTRGCRRPSRAPRRARLPCPAPPGRTRPARRPAACGPPRCPRTRHRPRTYARPPISSNPLIAVAEPSLQRIASICADLRGLPWRRLSGQAGLAALSYLQPVAVGVLKLRDGAPWELEHVRDELDAARRQLLYRLAAIVGLDRDRRWGASHRRLGPTRCPGPENQLEVVPPDADGQKPRPVGCGVLDPLLQAKDFRVEVERPVLVADEHARVEDLLQHCRSSVVSGHNSHDTGRGANVTTPPGAGE